IETISLMCPRLSPFGSTGLERRIERFDRRWLSSSFLSTPRVCTNKLRKIVSHHPRPRDAPSTATRLSGRRPNPTRAPPPLPAVAADCSPIYNILDDELAPR